ncbi:MAG: hypothetical protein H0U76_03910 [Ktedonobacteraceae bacterium]|nr:hypothetical protein [Ktedonobacteraceae bacterium]
MIELRCPEQLSTDLLIQEVQQEISQYLRFHQTDTTWAFELFRRAIMERDEQAWAGLYLLYSNQVNSWILRCIPGTPLEPEDVASLNNAAFAKFAHSLSPEKFPAFASAERVLAYFKLCVRSVVCDEMRRRTYRAQHEEPIEAIEKEPLIDDPADGVAAKLEALEVWQIIFGEVESLAEAVILQQHCLLGRPLRELPQRYPTMFQSVDDVYRVKRNVIERLRRNHQLLTFVMRRMIA